jgi:hypothetical protein
VLVQIIGRSESESAAIARVVRAGGHTPTTDYRVSAVATTDRTLAAWLRKNRPDVTVMTMEFACGRK